MNEKEHKLIVFMLAQQNARLMALVEALKSKGVLETDDLRAYERLIYEQENLSPQLFAGVAIQYEAYADGLGLQIDLKNKEKQETPSRPK